MDWQPISTAPKGGGAELVTDPAWVEPPRILLFFGDEGLPPERCTVLAYWDWYYAPGGNGYRDGVSGWVVDRAGETVDLHFNSEPTHWAAISPPRSTGDDE